MNFASHQALPFWLILVAGLVAPFAFPGYSNEIAVLWLMILFASTWDILGGQMGYNSLGNIVFFGAGMYICAVVQIGLFYDVGMYTSSDRTTHIVFSNAQYFSGFALGTLAAGVGAAVLAIAAGLIVAYSRATCRIVAHGTPVIPSTPSGRRLWDRSASI